MRPLYTDLMNAKEAKTTDAKAKALGNRLRTARELAGLSLRAAALRADISSAYLSQLEAGSVKGPSPHILHRLSEVYGVSYADLMTLAGYILPGSKTPQERPQAGLLEMALRSSTPLTDEERDALAEYLAWYRSRHRRPPEDL